MRLILETLSFNPCCSVDMIGSPNLCFDQHPNRCFNPCCSVDMIGSQSGSFVSHKPLQFQSLLFCGYDWKLIEHNFGTRLDSCFNPCCSVDMIGRGMMDLFRNEHHSFNPCCSVDMIGSDYMINFPFHFPCFNPCCSVDMIGSCFSLLLFLSHFSFNPCCSVDMIGSSDSGRQLAERLLFQSLLFCGYDWKTAQQTYNLGKQHVSILVVLWI